MKPAEFKESFQTDKGKKFDENKARFDLIPPQPLDEVARVFTIGANKYGDRNWELGISWGRIFAAMCRHAWAFWRGEVYDPVDGQHHLASVAWCALVLMEYEVTHPELDSRPKADSSKYHPVAVVDQAQTTLATEELPAPERTTYRGRF